MILYVRAALIVMLSAGSLFGRDIRGLVIAGDTRQPLDGAIVGIPNSRFQMQSGPDGRFLLPNVPEDAAALTVRFLGYSTETVALPVGTGDQVIELHEVILPARGVIVTAARARRRPA